MRPTTTSAAETAAPLFIADDVVLDFLNTTFGPPDHRRECLGSDQDVLDWLKHAGMLDDVALPPLTGKRGAVLQAALELRQTARELVDRRRAGLVGDASALNRTLALEESHGELVWKKGQPPRIKRRRRVATVEALLVPLAEAIARLLVEADFELIRKCESADCTLWFHDRTKSHHRRWCSMAACGNRAKAAAFRARQRANDEGAAGE